MELKKQRSKETKWTGGRELKEGQQNLSCWYCKVYHALFGLWGMKLDFSPTQLRLQTFIWQLDLFWTQIAIWRTVTQATSSWKSFSVSRVSSGILRMLTCSDKKCFLETLQKCYFVSQPLDVIVFCVNISWVKIFSDFKTEQYQFWIE